MSRVRRRKPVQRYVPVGYLAIAIALAVLLLPTALRPPPDQQNTSSAFSPDAPPDDTPAESFLASIRRASSSTAGGAPGERVEVIEVLAPEERRAARGRCYGDPPRQTESLYSALCVPAWTGDDNGGATWQGVTKDEIRLATFVGLGDEVQEGRLEREFQPDDAGVIRDLKVWQKYFNDRFELYGRYLQFYVIQMSSTDEDLGRAAVADADDNYKVFGAIGEGALPSAAATAEAIRREIVTWAIGQNPVSFYRDGHPYVYSFTMDSWQPRTMVGELACNQFVGKPPGLLNEEQDPLFDYNAPRVWGLLIYQDEIRFGAADFVQREFAKCGAEFEYTHEFNLTDNQQAIADAMAKFKAEGVTTMVLGVDGLSPAAFSNNAERIAYYPEYISYTGLGTNEAGRLMQDNQANHALALYENEMARADEDKDWFRAYKEVDPSGEPEPEFFRDLQQLSGAIQHAGPKLTPSTFWQGLRTQPYRAPDPPWSIGGGYRDPDPKSPVHSLGDYTYEDYVSLSWYDNAADDPESTSSGAWCHMFLGKRFRVGEMPTSLPWRDTDKCVYTVDRGQQG